MRTEDFNTSFQINEVQSVLILKIYIKFSIFVKMGYILSLFVPHHQENALTYQTILCLVLCNFSGPIHPKNLFRPLSPEWAQKRCPLLPLLKLFTIQVAEHDIAKLECGNSILDLRKIPYDDNSHF